MSFLKEIKKDLIESEIPHYEVIPYKFWKNKNTGRIVSIYGALPYTSDEDKKNWSIVTDGFTVRNNKTNTTGIGRRPFKTHKEAEDWIAEKERISRIKENTDFNYQQNKLTVNKNNLQQFTAEFNKRVGRVDFAVRNLNVLLQHMPSSGDQQNYFGYIKEISNALQGLKEKLGNGMSISVGESVLAERFDDVLGYTYNASVHCPDCARKDYDRGILNSSGDSSKDSNGLPQFLSYENEEVHPIFSTDEYAKEELCDDCRGQLYDLYGQLSEAIQTNRNGVKHDVYWSIFADYGYGDGWEEVHSEDDKKIAMDILKDYRKNDPKARYKIKQVKDKINESQEFMPFITTAKKDVKLKSGRIIPNGTKVACKFDPNNTIFFTVSYDDVNLKIRYELAHTALKGFTKPPSMDKLEEYSFSGVAKNPLGNKVEPDGYDQYGCPSWILIFSLI